MSKTFIFLYTYIIFCDINIITDLHNLVFYILSLQIVTKVDISTDYVQSLNVILSEHLIIIVICQLAASENVILRDELDALRETSGKVATLEASVASYRMRMDECVDLKRQVSYVISSFPHPRLC